MRKELELTFENLKGELENIGYTIRGQTNGVEVYYITNHKGQTLDLELWFPKTDARIEIKKEYTFSAVFYFTDCVLDILEGKAFSIRGKNDKNIFMLFSNYDK